MTKQEQIEEMQKTICINCKDRYSKKGYVCPWQDKDTKCYNCEKLSEALYNAGYRKVLIDTENDRTVDSVRYVPQQLIKSYTEREVEEARKDTAKAILNVLYFNLQNTMKGHIAKSNDYYSVIDRIQEIAKNYGVEIEE